MTRWRKILWSLLTAIVVIAGVAYAWRGDILLALMKRRVVSSLVSDPIATLPDGLHVGLCGAGAVFPDPTRAGPCVAVIAGKHLFVIDAGEGGTRNLQLMGLAPGRVEAVFLTHFHSDHIDGLGALMLQRWAGAAHHDPLPIFGPNGVETVIAGFNTAYGPDKGYRVAHHGPLITPPSGFGGVPKAFALSGKDPGEADVVLMDEDGLTIKAFPVDHRPVEPAVGYVFVYKDRKLVVSGDTVASSRVESEARGADLLLHEALSPKLVAALQDAAHEANRANLEHIFHDIVSYHTTPEQAAAIAKSAGVGYLLLYHIVPALRSAALETTFLGGARTVYAGPMKVGQDGDFISMPAGTKAITLTNLLQ